MYSTPASTSASSKAVPVVQDMGRMLTHREPRLQPGSARPPWLPPDGRHGPRTRHSSPGVVYLEPGSAAGESAMATVTGGELVVRTLLRAGVRHVFGLHGAHLETIFQSLAAHNVPIIDTRHEVAAGHAAEGYARAARTLGVAMVTAGPGFTNAITSLANAYLDRTPVLYLSGSAALRDAESNTLQAGIDQV